MTHGSLLIGLGFVVILGGVLVTIFAMKPKTPRYRRPLRTFVIGKVTPPPGAVGGSNSSPHAEGELEESFNLSLVLGPILAVFGVLVSIAGAILYAVNYQRKKQKDKDAIKRINDEEAARENLNSTPGAETSASGVTITFPEVATSVSDVQLSVASSQCTSTTPVTGL